MACDFRFRHPPTPHVIGFRPEGVDEAARRIAFEDHPAVGADVCATVKEGDRSADGPGGLDAAAEPVGLCEFPLRQGRPHPLGGGRDVGYVHELWLTYG